MKDPALSQGFLSQKDYQIYNGFLTPDEIWGSLFLAPDFAPWKNLQEISQIVVWSGSDESQ